MEENVNYYLKLRIPGIDENWMSSGRLSAEDAYNGYLSLRDFEFTEIWIKIQERKGKHTRSITFEELEKLTLHGHFSKA